MAELSGFFDAQNLGTEAEPQWDRTYLAEAFAKYFSLFISNGVFPNPPYQLMVVAATGYNVSLTIGSGFINGYWYRNTTPLSHSVEATDGVNNRIDRLVLRWSKQSRSIVSMVIKGTPALAALPPELLRNDDFYDISLAQIRISRTGTQISASDITDERLNNDVCGLVHAVVDQIDTTSLYNQIQGDLDDYHNAAEGVFQNYQQLVIDRYAAYIEDITRHEDDAQVFYDAFIQDLQNYKTDFQADLASWVETLKDILDSETASHLQNEIEALQSRVPAVVIGTVNYSSATRILYPSVVLGAASWAYGMGGAGLGPAGGTNLKTIEGDYEYDGGAMNLTVTVPSAYGTFADNNQISDNEWAFLPQDASVVDSLLLRIQKGGNI